MLPLLQELHSPIMSCPDFMDYGVLLFYGHGIVQLHLLNVIIH